VIRYRYNQQVSPPAPFVHVTLQCPVAEPALSEIPAQLDTAADVTIVPAGLVEQLHLVQFDAIEVLGFGGILKTVPTFLIRLTLRGEEPVVIEVISSAEEPHILLGRDVLNRYRFVLDGPHGVLEID
jgi:predicted aspartyl protease